MKKNVHLGKRLLSGLKQKGNLDLKAFSLFYSLFVNKVATLEEKTNFLTYFFIPVDQREVDLEVVKALVKIMCEEIPHINGMRTEYEFLSP